MNKQIEALKMAIETLERNKKKHHYCEDTWYSCPKHEDGCADDRQGDECTCGADEINKEFDKTINACKETLAEAEKQTLYGKEYMEGFNAGKMFAELESQEQAYQHKWDKSGERCVKCGDKDWMGGKCNVADSQEHEPVAWIKTVELLYIKAHKAEGIKHWKTNLGLKPEPDDSPLYTHPATWQSLSDDEIDNIWSMNFEFGFRACARAIEQALKEKNYE